MLDIKTMRAIGGLLARQARTRAVEPDVINNEIIDLAPLLQPWQAGTASSVISYKVGDVRTYNGQIWKCVQAHDHHGEPGWEPGTSSMWGAYHATDAKHALPWTKPTGAHDMYQMGEFMIWTDNNVYECIQATDHSPEEYAQAWKKYEGTDDGESGEVGTEEWPEFKKPSSADDAYYAGAKITFEGKRYICIAPAGYPCTYSPIEFPTYWELQG